VIRHARQRERLRCCHARTGDGTGAEDGPARWVRARGAGFTLIEVVTVLGLLVLLASIAWPIMENRITKAELPESAARVRDMLFMVRAESAMEHRRYRVRFEPDQQYPFIEYEPEPILRPNEWEAVESAWARWAGESLLLADVQVHGIRPGRPLYLEAISINDDPSTLMDEAEEALEDAEEAAEDGFDAGSALSAMSEDDIEIDEDRPIIVFEADGSTDWATLVLTRLPLDEVLEEEHEQIWVVLDGRTGLARIHELVTEEQLADPEFYVKREKLELPDRLDVDSLTFQVGGDEPVTSGDSSGGTAGDGSGATDAAPGDVAAVGEAIADTLGEPAVGRKGGGRNGGGGNQNETGSRGDSGVKRRPRGAADGTGASEDEERRDGRREERRPRRSRGG